MQNTLYLSNLTVQIANNYLFNSINLKISPGEIVCLLGKNGCGKSTLFKTIVGFLPQTRGELFIQGKSIETLTPTDIAELIAWLPQNAYRTEGYTVEEYVSFARLATSYYKSKKEYRISNSKFSETYLQMFSVAHLKTRHLLELSGGEWMRVQLARIWAQESQIMLLDEPNLGLDLQHLLLLAENIKKIVKDFNSSIMVITHDIIFAQAIATRIIGIENSGFAFDLSAIDAQKSEEIANLFQIPIAWPLINHKHIGVPNYLNTTNMFSLD